MNRYSTPMCVALSLLVVLVPGCTHRQDPWAGVPGSPRVLCSFAPVYCFALNVVGDEEVAVLSLLTTTGPHDYKPTAADNLKAAKADVFFENGLTLDSFVGQVLNSSGNKKVKVITLGKAIPEKDLLAFAHEHDHDHMHGGHHHHDHGEHDPHIWLGIPEAKLMVAKIRDALSEVNPARKEKYAANATKYLAELEQLLQEGKKAFSGKKNRKLVTMHDSLGYFARMFDLKIVDTIQAQPGIEASGKHLARLTEICQKEKVAVITYEPQFSKTAAERVEQEVRKRGQEVKLVLFDTLETAEPAELTPAFYVTKMRKNIQTLARALP